MSNFYNLKIHTGQQVVEEILDAQRPACPPEYFNIDIPEDHEYRTTAPKHTQLPFLRTRYDMRTGFSPGNPRQQVRDKKQIIFISFNPTYLL
jgi:dual oxidase